MGTLLSILKDNWEWRGQIFNLAIFDLKKKARGAVLGWAWLLIKPIIYMAVFCFALAIGLRGGGGEPTPYPYFMWLISGLTPWFFMEDMIGSGSDVLHKYPYLVNKMKFPLSGISTLYTLSNFFILLALMVVLLIVYVLCGMPIDVYLLQIPIILLLMFVFFDFFSILCSQLSAISRDFSNMMKILAMLLFWVSGIIFDTSGLAEMGFGWFDTAMLFNPVTFFCTAMRGATCTKTFFWNDPTLFGCFAIVFVVTVIMAVVVYKRFNEEVADVL